MIIGTAACRGGKTAWKLAGENEHVKNGIGINPRTGENIGTVLFEDDGSVREAVVGMNRKKIGGHRITVKESRFPGLPRCCGDGLQIDPMASSSSFFGRLGCVVHGLALATTDESLRRAFSKFGEIVSLTIAINSRTGENTGAVVFDNETSAREAIEEMNGKKIGRRLITVKGSRFPSFPFSGDGIQIDPMASSSAYLGRLGCLVYGLALGTTDESLRRAFSKFGEIVSLTIVINPRTGENTGAVVFDNETSAREAIEEMNGKKIGRHPITVKGSRFPGFPSVSWLSLQQ
ncbi:PREDICTED: polyadenylate-binding protein RBP47C'-like [Erythranthe guttata]|nr:PREDICTED: polyadenylate-binding protein RBP47C'-like [Erythranthe guttata]|eukprot:XP_012844459.1 PREDICTED: polyadenylate-binding protein RBP47C'-like [Erythranthe guttata]